MSSTRQNINRSDKSPSRATKPDSYRERSSETSPQAQASTRLLNNHPNSYISSPRKSLHEQNSADTASNNRQQRGRSLERKSEKDDSSEDKDGDNQQEDDPEANMMKLMGFGAFDSTKNKHVAGVGNGAVKKNKKSEFRQYMNREKGFNRALSPDRKK